MGRQELTQQSGSVVLLTRMAPGWPCHQHQGTRVDYCATNSGGRGWFTSNPCFPPVSVDFWNTRCTECLRSHPTRKSRGAEPLRSLLPRLATLHTRCHNLLEELSTSRVTSVRVAPRRLAPGSPGPAPHAFPFADSASYSFTATDSS